MNSIQYFDLETFEQKQEFIEKFKDIKFYFVSWYKNGFTYNSKDNKYFVYVSRAEYRDILEYEMTAEQFTELNADSMYYGIRDN